MWNLRRIFGRTKSERNQNADSVVQEVPHRGGFVDDKAREELSQRIVGDLDRRQMLRWGALAGGGIVAAILAQRLMGDATASPGDAIGGTSISDTDIDAKRIAAIRIATEFDGTKHAGTANDPWTSAALNGAMADLGTAGGTVYCPGGIYRVNPIAVPADKIRLVGAGSATQLVANASSFTPNDPVNGAMLLISGHLGVTVSDMALDGTGTNTCFGVVGTAGSDPMLIRLKLTNWLGTLSNRGRGISIAHNPATGPPFFEVVIQNCVFNGNQVGAVIHRTRFMIIGSRADSNVYDGFYIDGNQAQGSLIGNMTYNNGRSGINSVYGERSTLADNTSYADSTGIALYNAFRMLVHGNTINESGSVGILLNAVTDYCAVTANWVHDLPNSGTTGISVYNGCLYNLIQGNVIDRIGRYGILLSQNSGQNTIADNVCFDNCVTDAGYAGIGLATLDNHLFGNKCFDDQTTKTQGYGIMEVTGANSNYIHHNDLRYNLTSALLTVGANTLAERNLGVDINI